MQQVMIKDDSIRLGQFLKLAGVVESGAQVKLMLSKGRVLVNGAVEARRGRQLCRGDRVSLGGEILVVAGNLDGSRRPSGTATAGRGHDPASRRRGVRRVTANEISCGTSLGETKAPLVDHFDGLLLDLDGVVYVGENAVPRAVAALTRATRQDVFLGYVTNNAARSAEDVAAHIASFGLSCTPGQVVTSAQLAAEWLAARFDPDSPILVVGGAGLHQAITTLGLVAVTEAADTPVAVVQGFGPDVGWRQLAEASLALTGGVPWVATNLDLTVPTPAGAALGNGALVQALVAATGRRPDVVTGKPAREVFVAAVKLWGLARPLVVGDRMDTDIEGAQAAGLPSLLVLTGVSGVADLLAARPEGRPDFVGRDLTALHEPHPRVIWDGAAMVVGGWSATVSDGLLVLQGGGDPLSGVRAAAAMSWQAMDEQLKVDAARAVDRLESLLRAAS